MEYIYGINNVAPSCPVLHHSSPAGLCLLCLDDSSERKRPQFQFVHLSLSWPPDDLFLADNPNLYGRRPLTKGKIGCCCHKLQFFFTSKKKSCNFSFASCFFAPSAIGDFAPKSGHTCRLNNPSFQVSSRISKIHTIIDSFIPSSFFYYCSISHLNFWTPK